MHPSFVVRLREETMQFTIPYGQQSHLITVDESRADVILARSKNPLASATWESVVAGALSRPIDVPPISAQDLRGKKAVIPSRRRTCGAKKL
jgi:hypothetical protein